MPISYVYLDDPLTEAANDDFIIAFAGSTGTSNNTINAPRGQR